MPVAKIFRGTVEDMALLNKNGHRRHNKPGDSLVPIIDAISELKRSTRLTEGQGIDGRKRRTEVDMQTMVNNIDMGLMDGANSLQAKNHRRV